MRTLRTRRSARSRGDEEEEEPQAQEVEPQVEAGSSDDDDDAPEEVSLAATKKSAVERRGKEQEAIRHAKQAAKQRRRKSEPEGGAKAAAAAAEGAEGQEEEGEEEEELDLLPEEVLEAMADPTRDRRALERHLVSEQLKSFRAVKGRVQKSRAEAAPRRVGPVTVQVLAGVGEKQASEAARSFLQQRLYGESVKRSMGMLKPTKIGGFFVPPRD